MNLDSLRLLHFILNRSLNDGLREPISVVVFPVILELSKRDCKITSRCLTALRITISPIKSILIKPSERIPMIIVGSVGYSQTCDRLSLSLRARWNLAYWHILMYKKQQHKPYQFSYHDCLCNCLVAQFLPAHTLSAVQLYEIVINSQNKKIWQSNTIRTL